MSSIQPAGTFERRMMMLTESEERMEAADRTERYYERMGYDPPPHDSEEWRERFYNNLEDISEVIK
jgi:hypothetical protein